MKNVPVPVLVLSIIGILFGAIGLLGICIAPVMLFTSIIPNPTMEPLRGDNLYLGVTLGALVLNLIATVLLLSGSIGSLRLLPWARMAMLAYAIIAPVITCLASVFNILYTVPKLTAAMEGPAATGGKIGGYIGAVGGLFFSLAFSACILYFYTRPKTVNAFKGIFPEDPTNFPIVDAPLPPTF